MGVTPENIETAKRIARSYGATRLILFGSAQEDPEHARDLDLAVDGIEGWDVWRFAAALEREVNTPLDVVPLDGDAPFVRHVEKYGTLLFNSEEP